jgi:hypothetical protein
MNALELLNPEARGMSLEKTIETPEEGGPKFVAKRRAVASAYLRQGGPTEGVDASQGTKTDAPVDCSSRWMPGSSLAEATMQNERRTAHVKLRPPA